MQTKSSADIGTEAFVLPRTSRSSISTTDRLLILLINTIPMLFATSLIAIALSPMGSPYWKAILILVVLYLVPPLAARMLMALVSIPEGRIAAGTRKFFAWWVLFQLQVPYCRFPMLEELLRLIPGLYSSWLRIWGARVGRLTYWAAGVALLDRPFIVIGDDVVFGAGVRLNPHVLVKTSAGDLELLLGTVRIGDRAVVGGYSLFTAGAVVEADESPMALTMIPPFGSFRDGRRLRAKT